MRRYLRALYHAVFCWNTVHCIPDLALFGSMGDYLFPITSTRCGSSKPLTGSEIVARLPC